MFKNMQKAKIKHAMLLLLITITMLMSLNYGDGKIVGTILIIWLYSIVDNIILHRS